MKRYRIIIAAAFAAAVLLAGFLLTACGGKEEESETHMFYLNQERTKIVSEAYEPAATDTDGLIEEYIDRLSEDTGSVEYWKALPDPVKIERSAFEDGQLYLYFNEDYQKMSPEEEVLCRGVIVHTMMQVPEVKGVSFFVDDLPLKDANGTEVGIMTNESFVENPGEKINTIQEADINLYFASKDGDGLVKEARHVYYSSNISQEKLVMERLLEGPSEESSNAKSALPADTKLISVSVMDGVCFVNLNEGFLAQDFKVQEDVVIYSIVDSLTELPTVNKVQISVNGETDMVYREKYSLKDSYRQNLDLVVDEGAKVEEKEPEEEPEKKETKLIDTGK